MEPATKWTLTKLLLVITSVFQCYGVSLRQQLQHIADTQAESQGILEEVVPSRRHFYNYDPRELSTILGSPSMPSHLPEAEPILPGHTLIKPAMGMLKSSIKFPHRELEDGSGVYGNYENIGIRYDSKNERVLYSGFRRMAGNDIIIDPNPELRLHNKITLYPNDNKEPLTKKRSNGRIYLNRIYAAKLPVSVHKSKFSRRNIFDKTKIKKIILGAKKELKHIGEQIKKHWKKVKTWKKKINTKDRTILRSNSENTDTQNYEAEKVNLIVNKRQDAEKTDEIWNTKNTFNHIAIDQTAPDFADLFPAVQDQTRQWWFYNQEDLQRPLQTHRRRPK